MTGYYDDPVERWRLRIVRQWQEELLRHYACVIWGDTDELLLPEEGIIKYCEDVFIPSGKDRIRSECWSPVQQPDEPSVRKESGVSILENRSKMWRLHMYDKTLLVRTPQVYSKGMHLTYGLDGQGRRCDNGLRQRYHGEPIDPTLPMVHTWRVDMDDWYADGKWRYGVTPEECREYFRTNKCSKIVNDNGPHVDGDPHPIPQSWKDKLVWH